MSNKDLNELPTLKVNIPSFLLKTYEILENSSLSHIITWNNEGNAFIVLNSHELASKVLANFFKHKNYPSFLRQLNMYNFKKTKNNYGQSEFRHNWFRRGFKNMLQYIRRRNQEDSENKIEVKNTKNQEIDDNYKQEHDEMKKIVQEIQKTQVQMEIDFSASMEQNASANRSSQSIYQCLNQMQQQFNKKFDNLSLLLAKIVSYIPNLVHQMGDIQKYSYDEPSPNRLENNYIVPYSENNNQYSNFGSPYHQYSGNSPIHFLLSRQNQQFQDYCFQFDPTIFSFNRTNQYQQLALPPPAINSYLRNDPHLLYKASNNQSLQSSSLNSPYRMPSPCHTDSKNPESQQFNFYQQE